MELGAFVSLEDISDALPPYEEEVINVEMDPVLAAAYSSLWSLYIFSGRGGGVDAAIGRIQAKVSDQFGVFRHFFAQ